MMPTTIAIQRHDRRRYRRLKLRAEQADEQIGLVSGGNQGIERAALRFLDHVDVLRVAL
jgi:hypothetical protein